MRILVGWDNPVEAETIELFLNVGETEGRVLTSAADFERLAAEESWDVVLMALNFPDACQAYPLFERIRMLLPESPILGACYQGEVVHLAKFVSHGLHTFITRDAAGEFVFLLSSVIESAHQMALAQRARQLAERLREEIDSVRRLQESVIPHELPALNGYQVAARYEPAQIRVIGNQPVVLAGGDYYDVIKLDQDTLVLIVGDAAGHGIKACMSIMSMRTLIGMIRDRSYQDTSQFVGAVNRGLVSKAIVQDEGGFITLMYATLDTGRNRVQFTSAGHPMPFLQDLKTNEVVALGSAAESGLPLGILEDETYQVVSAEIPPNSRLLIYSDGLAEAFPLESKEYGQFGEEGIIRSLKSSAHLPLSAALDKLFDDSNAFTAGSGRHDDTSLMLIERHG